MMLTKSITAKDVAENSIRIERTLKMDDKDKDMIALFSDLMGVVGTQETNAGVVDKLESVEIQQRFFQEVLARSKEGIFEDDKFPRFFEAVLEIYEKARSEGILNEGVRSEEGFVMGIRGAISTLLLFEQDGFTVRVPEDLDWDAYFDIDFLATKEGKTYSISVKSSLKYLDPETGKLFVLKKETKPEGLPQKYQDMVTEHLWVNIPNQLSPESKTFCVPGIRNVAAGVPSEATANNFKEMLKKIGIA